MIQETLRRLVRRENLSEREAAEAVDAIFSGAVPEALTGAFLAALAAKGETVEELAGAARAMRRRAARIQVTAPAVVDTCGTGGDGRGTFNISTTTAFVVAGCGVTVAKHGNRSATGRCGSADLVEALGVDLEAPLEVVEEAVSEIGIGFLFAPRHHGAMKYAAPVRRALGIPTVFNLLGPLTNPAGADCQLLGVNAPRLTELFAEALRRLGSRRAFVVHGHDGLDEISVCARTRITELDGGALRTYELDPAPFFGRLAAPEEIAGGGPEENAAITRAVLAGERGPRRDVVLLNAAAALQAAGRARGWEEGIRLAAEAIDSGAAAEKLAALVRYTAPSTRGAGEAAHGR